MSYDFLLVGDGTCSVLREDASCRAYWVSWVAPVLGGISLPALAPVSTRPFRTSALHQFRLRVLRERITNELSKCLPN